MKLSPSTRAGIRKLMGCVVSDNCGRDILERLIVDCIHAATREKLLKCSRDFDQHADAYAALRSVTTDTLQQQHIDGQIKAYRFASTAIFDRIVKP